MRIDYYNFADCTRFRIPALNITSVGEELKAILLQSFDAGTSASYALEQAVNNPELVNSLVSQVAENLEFQRQNALGRVNEEAQRDVAIYQQEQQVKIQSIEDYLNPVIDEKKNVYTQKEKKVEEKTGYYSAAQRSLEKMRAQVQQRLIEVGGIEGYNKIEKINATLQPSQAPYAQVDSSLFPGANTGGADYKPETKTETGYSNAADQNKKKKKKELQKALAIATADKTIDPLHDQSSLDELVKENDSEEAEEGNLETMLEQPKESNWKRFWKRVWKIANYRIW